MAMPVRGRVHGSSIELEAPLPQLEGQRVLLLIEPDEPTLSSAEIGEAWEHWAQRGPQGPIEDEGEPEFP
jgi:hypothetical protein